MTVTVCGTFQSAGVNVRLAGETVPSVVSELLSGMVTSDAGGLLRSTKKVAVPPAWVVSRPEFGATVIPAGKMLARRAVALRPTFGSLMTRLPNGVRSAFELYW